MAIARRLIVWAAGLVTLAGLAGQTRLSQEQLGRVARGAGVVVQTDDGVRTAMPMPGFAYLVNPGGGDGQVQILPGTARMVVLSETPIRQPDGRYLLKWRPNPATVAVYVDGLRKAPTTYGLVWPDPNKLPDRVYIPGTTASSVVVVDYEVGTQSEY